MRKSIYAKQRALSDALHAAGFDRFADKSYNKTTNAQSNLTGRTHYVDTRTLRFFHSRITYAGDHCHGLIFAIIESVSANFDNTQRGFRFVLFDVFGSIIERADLDNLKRTGNDARKAMFAALGSLDVMAHYREAITIQQRKLQREMHSLSECRRFAR